MPAGYTVGAALGFLTVLYSNGVRKVPLMREPWEHFIGAGIGAFLGNELVKYTDRTEREIEELLRRREESNKGFRVPSMAGGPTPGASNSRKAQLPLQAGDAHNAWEPCVFARYTN